MLIGICDKSYQILQSYFQQVENIDKVVIFGSRMLGTYCNGADIDLALFGKNLNMIKINAELEELQMPYMYDVLEYETLQNKALKDHIRTQGKVFFQKKVKIVLKSFSDR